MSRRIVITGCLIAAGGLLVGLSATATAGNAPRQGAGHVWLTTSAGYGHTCGIRTDRTLWCWGDNGYGQLGMGDYIHRWRAPTQIGTDTDWAHVESGGAYTCGIRTDRTLWCWGDNRYGQLGLGDTNPHVVPVRVGTDTDWADLDAGGSHTCGIRTNHTLWCWGYNAYGELGLGDTAHRLTPTQVGADTTWADVQLGILHTCAIRVEHTLWCWGYNSHGQLGLGDTIDRQTPIQVGIETNWAEVTGGNYHTCGDSHRPHPVVLGLERLWPARTR